ncbi:hypothetical protein A9Q78_06340 [Methylophaga sp. 41_12_T18]|nr:hypothetical protein A9Q78_06340 [Methylophaga sp. 41_12_T18]
MILNQFKGKVALLVIALCFIVGCNESPTTNSQQVVNDFVKGSYNNILKQNKNQPYLLMFWSQDCAYCMKELELLGSLVKSHPEAKLITVATDPFLDVNFIRNKMASFGLQDTQAWVFAEPHAETLYFEVSPRWRGELPFTILVDGDNQKTKKIGMLSEHVITTWLSKV